MSTPTSPNTPPAHRPQGSGMTNDDDLRTALTKLAVKYENLGNDDVAADAVWCDLINALTAHPAPETDEVCGNCLGHGVETCATHPTPVSDTRREDDDLVETVARALSRSEHPGVQAYIDARAVLAVLPAPPVVDEAGLSAYLDSHLLDAHEGPSADTLAALVAAYLRGATRG